MALWLVVKQRLCPSLWRSWQVDMPRRSLIIVGCTPTEYTPRWSRIVQTWEDRWHFWLKLYRFLTEAFHSKDQVFSPRGRGREFIWPWGRRSCDTFKKRERQEGERLEEARGGSSVVVEVLWSSEGWVSDRLGCTMILTKFDSQWRSRFHTLGLKLPWVARR